MAILSTGRKPINTFERASRLSLLVLTIMSLGPTFAAAASFRGLAALPGSSTGVFGNLGSRAHGISGDGSIVVGVSPTTVDEPGTAAVRWHSRTGAIARIEDPTGALAPSEAFAASHDGSIVVGDAGRRDQGFRWSGEDGSVLGLRDPSSGLTNTRASAVSSDGSTIVGFGTRDTRREAFRWDAANGLQGLGSLAIGSFGWGVNGDGSVVVGETGSSFGIEAFRWTADDGMRGLGGIFAGTNISYATGVSPDGYFLIGAAGIPGGQVAFRWLPWTGFQPLGDLESAGNSMFSQANAISADGQVVVGSRGAGPARAFIWDPVRGIRALDVVLAQLGIDLSGWTINDATGISADGLTIVGNGFHNGRQEAWVAVIPEPSTALLLGIGIGALAIRPKGEAPAVAHS